MSEDNDAKRTRLRSSIKFTQISFVNCGLAFLPRMYSRATEVLWVTK